MTIHIYSLQELNKAAEKYCQKYCSLRDNEYCVLNAVSSGIICPISYYLDKLETGELRK
jgi:hypothetical protein